MNREHPDPGSKISSCCSELTDVKLRERPVAPLRSCPSCGHEIDCNTDMIGMPAGVKFDPSDQELIYHLQTMVDEGGSGAHPFIDKFITTIKGENGICYTHPENLPGVRRDGLSKHFFHRSSKAYTNGTRKRRKINGQCSLNSSNSVTDMRWHKTGKTRPVIVGGQQKGCKKILVLYTNFGKHRRPEKTNWVMHQYHLGDQEEKDGELVVSKIFYQTQTRQPVATVMAAAAEPHMMKCGKAAETSGDRQDVFSGFAASNTTSPVVKMQQQQQQRANQADGKFSVARSKKRCHEVGVGDHETYDQGEHQIRSYQHKTPAPTSINTSALPNNASIVLDRRSHHPASFLLNEIFEEKHQQKEVGRMSAGLEEPIKRAPAESEAKRPYRYWPPDRIRDQHG